MLHALEARPVPNATHRSRRHNDVGRESLAGVRQGCTPAAVRHPRTPIIPSPARNRPSRVPAHSAVEIRSPPVSPSDRAHVVLPPSDLNSAILPHSRVTASGDGPPGSVKSISSNGNALGGAYVLSNPDGKIEITGGTYNAVAGHHIAGPHISVVVHNGSRDESHANTIASEPILQVPATEDREGAPTEDLRGVRHEASPPNCSMTSSPITPSTISLQSSNDSIYYRSLASKKRGSPLWMPEPNKQLPVAYQRNGLMICDAGIIGDRGYFDTLFNISLPPDHPLAVNSDELPDNFSPMLLKPRDIIKYSEFKKGSSLSSESIKKLYQNDDSSDLIFESSASEGGILTLPDGSNSQDLANKKKLQVYLSVHGEEMYKCALVGHGRNIRNGDLRVVTGCDKTTNWGMAAFSNSMAQEDSFRLKFRPRDQANLARTHGWEYSGTAEVKAGPDVQEVVALRMDDPSEEGKEYENQSVFVRTHNMTLREDIWNNLLSECGEVEVDNGPDTPTSPSTQCSCSGGSPNNSSQSAVASGTQSACGVPQSLSNSVNTLTVHPAIAINKRLLKLKPNARIAITEDEDWISVLTEEDSILPLVDQLWDRIMATFAICEEDGVVFLEKLTTQSTGLPANEVPSRTGLDISTEAEALLPPNGSWIHEEPWLPTTRILMGFQTNKPNKTMDRQLQDGPGAGATWVSGTDSFFVYTGTSSGDTSFSMLRYAWDVPCSCLVTIISVFHNILTPREILLQALSSKVLEPIHNGCCRYGIYGAVHYTHAAILYFLFRYISPHEIALNIALDIAFGDNYPSSMTNPLVWFNANPKNTSATLLGCHGNHPTVLQRLKRWSQSTIIIGLSISWTFNTKDYKYRHKLLQHISNSRATLNSEEIDPFSLTCIGCVHVEQGHWKEAEVLEVVVMEKRKQMVGDDQSDTLTSMGNLASTYRNLRRWKEAEAIEVVVMEKMRHVLGEDHPDTLTSMGNLASTYWNLGLWKEAEALEVVVMEKMRHALGEEHPRNSSQLHRRARVMSRNDDGDTIASSVAASDYQSSETPGTHFHLGDMSDDESSSPIQPQDSTHAEGFSSSPQQVSRFFPTPTSVASLGVRQTFSHTVSDLGSNDGNADIEVEDEGDHRQLLPPTPNLQKRSASYHNQNPLWPSPTALSSSLSQPFPNHLSSALSTAQDSVSLLAPMEVPNYCIDPEVFTDRSPAPTWNPLLPSSHLPVLLQLPPYSSLAPPPPPAYTSPQKLAFHVYGDGEVSINAVKHDNVEIHVWGCGRVDFNGYSQGGEIEDDQVDTGKGGGDWVGMHLLADRSKVGDRGSAVTRSLDTLERRLMAI